MAIISFDEGDVLAKKIAEPGWVSARILALNPKQSKEGKSINYWTTFKLEAGESAGKEIEISYNTNTKGRSILGGCQFSNSADLMEVACAIQGIPIPPKGMQVDTDELVGKQLDILITIESSDGIICNGISAYLPYGKSTELSKSLTF